MNTPLTQNILTQLFSWPWGTARGIERINASEVLLMIITRLNLCVDQCVLLRGFPRTSQWLRVQLLLAHTHRCTAAWGCSSAENRAGCCWQCTASPGAPPRCLHCAAGGCLLPALRAWCTQIASEARGLGIRASENNNWKKAWHALTLLPVLPVLRCSTACALLAQPHPHSPEPISWCPLFTLSIGPLPWLCHQTHNQGLAKIASILYASSRRPSMSRPMPWGWWGQQRQSFSRLQLSGSIQPSESRASSTSLCTPVRTMPLAVLCI